MNKCLAEVGKYQYCGGVKVEEKWSNGLVESIDKYKIGENSTFFIDLKVIEGQIQRFGNLFPNILPFYAVKANDDENILRLLASWGVNFDCASRTELQKIERIIRAMERESEDSSDEDSRVSTSKVFPFKNASDRIENPSRCIFANPFKRKSDMNTAVKLGVDIMTFDCLEELEKCLDLESSRPVQCLLRMECDCSGSITLLSDKFGACIETCKKMIDFSLEHREKIEVIGVAFHVGSGCSNPTLFNSALKQAKELFEYGRSKGLERMNVLDVGGGFPGSVTTSGLDLLLKISKCLKNGLLEEFGVDLVKGEMNGMKIIAEPGRYFVSASHVLVTPIIASKIKQGMNHYVITEGLYASLNNIIFDGFKIEYGKNFDVVRMNQEEKKDTKLEFQKSVIWGPTCDSLDKVGVCDLPPALTIGDLFVFYEMGAYTCCATSTFNGMPMAQKFFL